MNFINYKLNLGSNLFDQPIYAVSYEKDKNTGDKIHLFTLENSDHGLLLTTEIRDKDDDRLATIYRNEFKHIRFDKIDAYGEIEIDPGLTLIRKSDNVAIFNAKLNKDGCVAVTGTFCLGKSKKCQITDEKLLIKVYDSEDLNSFPETYQLFGNQFYGPGGVTITDNGINLG
jgi:hypothetical protein